MDHTYQRPLQLPACCSVLSAEEMTYTEGGALSINITPEQVMAFGINATVNLLGMMGRYAFQAAVSGMQNALNDGLFVLLNHINSRGHHKHCLAAAECSSQHLNGNIIVL